MGANVNASIHIGVNSSAAMGELAAMQAKMAALNKSMVSGANASSKAQLAQAAAMGQMLNRSGMWTAAMQNMQTATGRMAAQFDKGTVSSFNEYRKNSKAFSRDHSAINQLAAQRVRALQTQYAALGKEVDGTQRVMKMQPTGMMRDWGADAMFAQQKAVLFRRNLEMGANSMINWGKNTQWAGRQMMVGMGVPMALAAAGAVSAFKDIETASISFKRVYGDATTSSAEKAEMLGKIQSGVAQDMTKYGIAVSDTLDVAAKAAATGQQGDNLVSATRETMRLATLGQLDYDQALQSTIATQTAFGVSAKGMTRVTDFLNAAENQTILSMDDMTKAIPRVAPVIRGLGGDVEDLGVLMTALRAGGVTAEQGANALKSGLASLINPTSSATEAMESLGIPLDKIVKSNKGDLIGTVQDFGKALKELPKFEQQQALESLFGKYQYARMGALFRNINSKQAKETARLSEESSANLAKMSENELGQIADSALTQFQGAIERLKAAAAPLGEQVLRTLTPMIDGVSNLLGFFANNDAARNVALFGLAFAGLAGVATMVTGVFANFFGTMAKGGLLMRRGMDKMMGRSLPRYSSIADLEASAAAKQLGASAQGAAAGLYAEAGAAKVLAEALTLLDAKQTAVIANNGMMGPGGAGGVVVPKSPTSPSGPTGASVVPPGPMPSQADRALMLKDQKTHLGGMMPITSQAEIDRILARGGLSDAAKTILGRGAGNVLGRDSRTMFVSSALNNALKDGSASGSRMLSELNARGHGISMAPLVMDIARNMGEKDAAGFVRSDVGQQMSRALFSGLVGAIDPDAIYHDSDLKSIAGTTMRDALVNVGHVGAVEAYDRMGQITDVQAYDPKTERAVGRDVAAVGDSGILRPARQGTETILRNTGNLDESGLPKLAAAQERGAVVLDANNAAVEEHTQTTQDATKQTNKNLRVARTAEGDLGMKQSSFLAPKPVSPIRQGGAFTPDANKWSNRLFGLGMAADMTTMGLMAMGKDVPAWSHMLGMGAMAVGMMPDILLKPAAKIGTGLKALGPKLVSSGGALGKLSRGALIGAEMLGMGNKKGILSFVGKLGIAGMAVAAVGGTAMYLQQSQNRLLDRTRDLVKTYTMSDDVATAYAQEQGKESYSMKQNRLALEEATDSNITQAEASKEYARLQTQSGQAILQTVTTAKELGNAQTAIQSIVGQVGGLYGEGLIGRQGAVKFGGVLGQSIGLSKAETVDLVGRIKEVTGKGIDSPIEVKAKLGEMALDPNNIAQTMGASRADRSWYDTAWAALTEGNWNSGPTAASAPTGDEVLDAKAAGAQYAQLGLGNETLSIDKLYGAMGKMNMSAEAFSLAGQQMALTIDSAFTASGVGLLDPVAMDRMNNLVSTASNTDERGQIERGVMAIKLEAGRGNIDGKAFSQLFSGTDEMSKNVAIAFDTATDGQTQKMAEVLDLGGKGAKNLIAGLKAGVPLADLLSHYKAGKDEGDARSRGRAAGDDGKGKKGTPDPSHGDAGGKEGKDRSNARKKGDDGKGGKPKPDISGAVSAGAAEGKAQASARERAASAKVKSVINSGAQSIIDAANASIESATSGGGKTQEVKIRYVPGEMPPPPEPVEQQVIRTISVDTTIIPPFPQVQQVMRLILFDMTTIAPFPTTQYVWRSILFDASSIPPPPVTQYVVRKVIGGSATGGPIPGYAKGGNVDYFPRRRGKISGPGGKTGDKIPAMLSDGEFVIKASSVDKYGTSFMDRLNSGVIGSSAVAHLAGGTGDKKPDKGGSDKKDSKDSKSDSDKWNYKKDVVKPVLKNDKIYSRAINMLNKFNGRRMAVLNKLIEADNPRAFEKYKGMNKKSKKKFIQAIISQERKEAAIDIRNSFAETQKTDDFEAKAWNKRIKIAKKNSGLAEQALNLSDEEAIMLDKMSKKKRREYLQKKAERAAIADREEERLNFIGMTSGERNQEKSSQYESLAENERNRANSKGELAIMNSTFTGLFGEALSGSSDYLSAYTDRIQLGADEISHKNDLEQRKIDDINEAYDEQAKILDKVQAAQQAVANVEKARLGVAGALASGDIAAAAAAMQEAKQTQAQFAQEQMRAGLDAEREARIKVHQDAIDANQDTLDRISDTIFEISQTISETQADAALLGEAEADIYVRQNLELQNKAEYWSSIAADIERSQTLLNNVILNNPPAEQAEVKPAVTPGGPPGGDGPPGGLWQSFEKKFGELSKKEQESVIDKAFNGKGAAARKKMFEGWGKKKQDRLIEIIKDKKISNAEEKEMAKFAKGGWVGGYGSGDKVPALLTPGEFVVNKLSAQKFGGALENLNSPSFRFASAPGMATAGSGVGYNGGNTYTLTFNMSNTNADVNQLADMVVRKIDSVDSRAIRKRGW